MPALGLLDKDDFRSYALATGVGAKAAISAARRGSVSEQSIYAITLGLELPTGRDIRKRNGSSLETNSFARPRHGTFPRSTASSSRPFQSIDQSNQHYDKENSVRTHIRLDRRLAVAPTRAASSAGASQPSVPAQSAAKDEPVVLSIFEVTGDKDEGYRSTQTVSGSRTLAELRDTPNSISVVNRELLDDLIATKLSDALFFGVTGEIDTNGENHNEVFVFRGIGATLRLRNGVTWFGSTSDSFAIERAELLRGPQAFLYGEGTAGGVVNQLTKQAAYRDFENMNLIFGSYNMRRAELDLTGGSPTNLRCGRRWPMRRRAASRISRSGNSGPRTSRQTGGRSRAPTSTSISNIVSRTASWGAICWRTVFPRRRERAPRPR